MSADASLRFLDPQLLGRLRGLRLRPRHIVEGSVAGLHRSPFRGFSIEFAEHREYVPGDDLRYLDWKVFGRTDKLYLKQFEDETNLLCHLVLDVSESMAYRGPDARLSKLDYARQLAAALAWLVLEQQDAVGLATFDSQIRASIRPSSSRAQLKDILSVLEATEGRAKTATGPIFHELAQRLAKRGVVVVISDLFDNVETLLAGLRHFRYRRHDVIVLHVMDPAELDFPFDRPTLFRGLEQLPEVLTDPRALRRAYLDEVERFLSAVKAGCRAQRVDYQLFRTDRPPDVALATFLAARAAASA